MKRFSLHSCSVFSMKRFDDHGFASSSTNSFIDRSNGDLVESTSRRVGMFLFNIFFFFYVAIHRTDLFLRGFFFLYSSMKLYCYVQNKLLSSPLGC